MNSEKQLAIPAVVYVVAWSYDGGGGFDWYYDQEPADAAWRKEKENADDRRLAKEGWTAYRFEFQPSARTAPGVTREIDASLLELCRQAADRYCPPAADTRLVVPTYYGDAQVDFAAPFVPVLICEADGLRVLLGTDDRDTLCADVQLERRPGGWAIFLHPLAGSDPSGYVYFLDDGRSFVVAESALGPTPAIQVVERAPDELAKPVATPEVP